jgi:hypothetical protein
LRVVAMRQRSMCLRNGRESRPFYCLRRPPLNNLTRRFVGDGGVLTGRVHHFLPTGGGKAGRSRARRLTDLQGL